MADDATADKAVQATPAPSSGAEPAPTPAPAPAPVSRAKQGSRKMLLQSLSPEQRAALKAEEKAKAETVPTEPAKPTAQSEAPKDKAKPLPAQKTEDDGEVHRFGEEPAPTGDTAADETPAAEAAPEELTEEQINALDDKARRIYREAQKEAAKVRKRAQEAEAKLQTELQARSEIEKERDTLKTTMEEVQARAHAMAGNPFATFKDAKDVAAWGENAKEALVLIRAQERAIKAGRAEPEDEVPHVWPNGETGNLTPADKDWLERRVQQAQDWFEIDSKVSDNQEQAAKLVQKHKASKGYEAAYEALAKDPALHTRQRELVAKAAYYDMLNARKAVVTFPDAAGAAKSAPTPKTDGVPGRSDSSSNRRPPSESPASAPRMVHTEGDGADDIRARKSQLMEQARTASTASERQRLIKEAIKLGNPERMASRR